MKNFVKSLCVCLIGSLLLISCDPGPSKGKDGYNFESKEYEKTSLQVEIVIIPDQNEFNRLAQEWAPGVEGLQAFGRLQPAVDKCIIYIKEPTWQYHPEFIGHEMAHCIWGRWHQKINAEQVAQGYRPGPI